MYPWRKREPSAAHPGRVGATLSAVPAAVGGGRKGTDIDEEMHERIQRLTDDPAPGGQAIVR